MAVMVNAQVSRVHTQMTMNGKLSAVGVEFSVGDQEYSVNAIEEVILSAGYVKLYSPTRLIAH